MTRNSKKKTTIKKNSPRKAVPVAYSHKMSSNFKEGHQPFILRRREFVDTLSFPAGDDFHLKSYTINAGNAELFPWLSTIATNFETYRFKNLKFEYISRLPSTNHGSVTLAVEFDPTDPDPDSLKTLRNMSGCVTDNVWQDLSLRVNTSALNSTAGKNGERYVSDGPTSSPFKYDAGKFYFNTDASLAHTYQLYVTYEVLLFTPGVTQELKPKNAAIEQIPVQQLAANIPIGEQKSRNVLASNMFDNSMCKVEERLDENGDAYSVFKLAKGIYNLSGNLQLIGQSSDGSAAVRTILSVVNAVTEQETPISINNKSYAEDGSLFSMPIDTVLQDDVNEFFFKVLAENMASSPKSVTVGTSLPGLMNINLMS